MNVIDKAMHDPSDENIKELRSCISSTTPGFLELTVITKEHFDKFYGLLTLETWFQNKDVAKLYAGIMQYTNDCIAFKRYREQLVEEAARRGLST